MINLFQVLKDSKKPLSIMDLRQKGIDTNRTELRALVRKGLLVKAENWTNNTKNPIKGTMFYTYSLPSEK